MPQFAPYMIFLFSAPHFQHLKLSIRPETSSVKHHSQQVCTIEGASIDAPLFMVAGTVFGTDAMWLRYEGVLTQFEPCFDVSFG